MIVLIDDERRRFIGYLYQEAETALKLAEQMAKIKVPLILQDRQRAFAQACIIIADHLKRVEELAISNEPGT